MIKGIKESSGGIGDEDKARGHIKRMTGGKDLPIFQGDVLEWPAFKRAFEESTKKIGFTQEENMIRLEECVKGVAKEAVALLMVTAHDTIEIMELLHLRFGNPAAVASRIIVDLKALPKTYGVYNRVYKVCYHCEECSSSTTSHSTYWVSTQS